MKTSMDAPERAVSDDQLTHFFVRVSGERGWIEKERKNLLFQYGECLVAVKDKKVVASDVSMERLVEKLDNMRIPTSEVVIEHLRKDTPILLL